MRVLTLTRRAITLLVWAVNGAAATLLILLALSVAVGQHPLVVLSGSMAPAVKPGDVLIERKIAPQDAHVGDVITFREPAGEKRLLTHRVRSVRAHGGQVTIATKGDANNSVERFSIPAGGSVGTPAWRIPMLGYATTWVRTPTGLFILILVPMIAFVALELWDIWGPLRRPRLHLPHHRRTTHGMGT